MKTILNGVLAAAMLSACATSDVADTKSSASLDAKLASSEAHETLLRTTSNPKIRQGYVNTPDGQLHYWEAGQGPALLLVHQAASSGEEYAALAATPLAEKYRLIAYDWPGHGMSDDPSRELLVDDFTASGMAVLNHLGVQRAHVLGHHGGSLVALNLAWKNPSRFDRLILSGTSGVKDMVDVEKFSESLGLNDLNRIDRSGQSISAAWGRFTKYMPGSTPGEVIIPFMNNVTVRARPFDAHYGILRFDRRPAYAALKGRRMLFMQGENDAFVSDQETLLEVIPNSERVAIKNAGTFLFFEAPDAAAEAIIGFLQK